MVIEFSWGEYWDTLLWLLPRGIPLCLFIWIMYEWLLPKYIPHRGNEQKTPDSHNKQSPSSSQRGGFNNSRNDNNHAHSNKQPRKQFT